jgi:hypothetical protein
MNDWSVNLSEGYMFFTANRSSRSVVFHKYDCSHVKKLLKNYDFKIDEIVKTSDDQIWFTSESFNLIALKNHFKAADDRLGTLEYSYNACQKCCV